MQNCKHRVIGACFVCFSLLFVGCDSGTKAESQQKSAQKEEPQEALQTTFNTTDKSSKTNGNFVIAMAKIQKNEDKLEPPAAAISASSLTKSPYSNIGKLIRIKGKSYKVEELPLTPGMTGQWAEILLLSPNNNNPLGASTIDFLYYGDISKINSGDDVWCTGYFAGSYDSQNAMGGTVEALALVGNKISE